MRPDIALLMMSLVELGTAICFEHENNRILSKYFSHVFPLPQGAGSTVPREGIDLSVSMHIIMGGGKGKIRFGKTNVSVIKILKIKNEW